MIKVYEPLGATIALMGEQKVKDNSTWRKFRYIFESKVSEGTLIYNTLTRELLLLNEEEYQVFNSAEDCDNELFKLLVKKWFLVPAEHDDAKFATQIRDYFRMMVYNNTDAPMTNFTILTTTRCNARCFYCFERDRIHQDMDNKTAEDVAEYIIRSCRKKDVKLNWFGGEPLYNSAVMDIICQKLKDAGINFKSEIITNGYLFDDENVKKAKELWNVRDVQITLDGTENVYNRCKNYIYKDGRSPFKVVNDNIERLLEVGIITKIRMNMDSHNENDLYELIDYLEKRFGKYKNFVYYAHLLFEDTGKLQMQRNDLERQEMQYKYFKLDDLIYENQKHKMARNVKHLLQYNQCMADDCSSTTVLPGGKLGKCEHYSDTDFWGSIYNNDVDYDVINDFRRIKYLPNKCEECPVYPACIQLIRCAQTIPDRCDEVDKMLTFRGVNKAIMDTYRVYKLEQEKNTDKKSE